VGDKGGIAGALADLGLVALSQRDDEAGRALLKESLTIHRELGNRRGIIRSLEEMAEVAATRGEPERAACLFGVTEGLRESLGARLPPTERAKQDRCVAAVRGALGEEAFAAAWAEGRAMPLEEAVRYALVEQSSG
jgi:hypothetical protein